MANLNFSHGGNIYGLKEKSSREIIDFSASINPLGLPFQIKQAVSANFKRILHYPDPEAKGLTRKIAEYWKIETENILVGNGSVELIYLIVSCFRPGTTLIPVPTFSEYERAARMVKSEIKFLRLKESEDFCLDVSRIDRTDMLFLCNPNNPTGNLLFKARVIAGKLPANLVVNDEAFMDFLPDQQEQTLIPQAVKSKKIVVLRTLTKFFALPGLRIGYLVAHKEIIRRLKKCQPPWNVNALAQLAGERMLPDQDYSKKTYELIEKERSFLLQRIERMAGLKAHPSRANFILVKIENKKLTSARLVKKLLRQGILVRDCANFRGLGNKFIRVAVRTHKENLKLIAALNSTVVSA